MTPEEVRPLVHYLVDGPPGAPIYQCAADRCPWRVFVFDTGLAVELVADHWTGELAHSHPAHLEVTQ